MNPQIGWVKAGGIEKTELLERYAELQKRYDDLISENKQLKDSALLFDTEILAQGNNSLVVEFEFQGNSIETELSYNAIFFGIGDKLFAQCEITDIKRFLREMIFEKYTNTQEFLDYVEENELVENKYNFLHQVKISEKSLTEIEIQLQALELITVAGFAKQFSAKTLADIVQGNNQPSIHTEIAKTWTLTEKGKKYFFSQRAIRREQVESMQH